MRDLVDTTEMYLRTVYELEEEGIVPLRARIAERLDQSGPTVSQTVARMERDGLLVVEEDRSLSLTEEGRARATRVMRKHRLAERLMVDVLGMDIAKVHDEACRWEHVMSDDVERRVVEVVSDPSRSPFGNPIPGLTELGLEKDNRSEMGERTVDLDLKESIRAEVIQIHEILQLDATQFSALSAAGIKVGSQVTVAEVDGIIEVTSADGSTVELADDLAHAFRVRPLD
ncbi:metal-dependent transcriptional regulator [Corynebacterium cystitidis]|uniref:Diphtheria toxin repressor n=1 Tax=Corynebacterium cystitidis DSM 20524 TaxID=1121357 RepID=A0A1H9P8F9_9CORY|nr:metal-dependent transcriptional regulator [Corynebacterium cystitidis]WJY82584.1 Diphtheria toxin repressor [Corynebacterium cystitidis DSM 20524]SER44526.1 iron (metal) dependent repressor, DtxR family [Corynebacterium cystitidis DSM 20524]SNV73133.1 iron-dependent repressor [Corynebacterium cystitidis]